MNAQFTNSVLLNTNLTVPTSTVVEVRYNQVGVLTMFAASGNYSVLCPQLYTNTICLIPFGGTVHTQTISSFPGPSSTNFCDLRFEPQEMPPTPKLTPGGPMPQLIQVPLPRPK